MPCCSKIPKNKELKVFGIGFAIINGIQSIAVMILCAVAVHYFGKTNISSFLPVDMISLFISVIILGFIIIVVGWVAAVNNTGLGWIVFHCCMAVLLIIEVFLVVSTSSYSGFVKTVSNNWYSFDDPTKYELQSDLSCCGLSNSTDSPALPCPGSSTKPCMKELTSLYNRIKRITSTAMFVCFIFGIFIDMSGYAMCINPEKISLEEQQDADAVDVSLIDEEENFRNPFVI
ncbi:Tetraspanin family protein [Trichomonas vaginalis G3]|uniref:Tetraspanin family protein n=1 Tax=Trichomonas vaginalis (strain ATCC PRA-98 / G3) TaxID=412133 RepID=A2DI21_TRIV3|nr:hypothetical protein TVAGG3_0272300 [Trichomonas vaginalis G3]EAY20010.1 Tetraspanin family protein [Trichomonas vaginalis G3]KAI5525960.1 hypothetical protein TVAGG3_0272300 [Trichomonas vaginalis G3]|eukprot:XP_001580996.1 Tetraspanin family protein [Trichomonas vaginalis G3]